MAKIKAFFIGITLFMFSFGCAALIAGIDKYATPEKTWETYKEAVMRGDVTAALDCFIPNVRDDVRRRFEDRVIGIDGMRKRAKSIKDIEFVRSGVADHHGLHPPSEYQVYRIITEKGKTDFTIFFVKDNGEWKIESLPY